MATSSDAINFKYGPSDALSLPMSTFSGIADEFEVTARSLPPLLLTQALEGHSVSATDSPLLSLPDELLHHITSLLEPSDIANFGLVNTDCRQLARVVMFEHVRIDYNSLPLLHFLTIEARDRLERVHQARRLTLGACIRRITIATSPKLFIRYHEIDMNRMSEWDEKRRDTKLQEVINFYYRVYMGSITTIIASALPNVEIISWYDSIRVHPLTLSALLSSPARHIKLDRIQVDDELMRAVEAMPQLASCRVETLDLCVVQHIHDLHCSIYPFVAFLLQRCAPSLMSFKWDGSRSATDSRTDEGRPQFPRLSNLRKLSLLSPSIQSSAELESMVLPGPQCKLTHLGLEFCNQVTTSFMNSCGNMPALKTFVWNNVGARQDIPMRLLEENSQLNTLSLEYYSPRVIDGTVLPLLVDRFRDLTSLELGFDEATTSISQTALHAISKLKSLQQLHLTAGHQFGWMHDWVVDHSDIRKCIRHLPALKRLALSRDTYRRQGGLEDRHTHYYDSRHLDPEDENETALLRVAAAFPFTEDHRDALRSRFDWAWEMAHRRKMLCEARKYVHLRHQGGPKLEVLYFGQIPMQVELGWWGWRAVAVSERRDDCYALLQRMFKGSAGVFGRD